jgi:hypothetical protein
MKKFFVEKIIALSIAMPVAICSFAQSSSTNAVAYGNTTHGSVRTSVDADKFALNNLSMENSRVYKSFTKNYPNASEIGVGSNDASVFIYCVVDGIPNRITYTKGGKTESITRTYNETKLDPNVLSLVKLHYSSYSIFSVTEIFANHKTTYLINMENDKMWKVIRVADGEMDVYREYSKTL